MDKPARVHLLLLKGAITELDPEDQKKVSAAVGELRLVMAVHGPVSKIALALLAAEFAAEDQLPPAG